MGFTRRFPNRPIENRYMSKAVFVYLVRGNSGICRDRFNRKDAARWSHNLGDMRGAMSQITPHIQDIPTGLRGKNLSQ